MNQAKLILERVGGIICIVVGSFLSLGTIMILSNSERFTEAVGFDVTPVYIIILLACIALVVLGSLLCPTPRIKNGKVSSRFGIALALCIINGIIAILELIGGGVVYSFIFLIPLAIIIVSMCLRNEPGKKEEQVNIGE